MRYFGLFRGMFMLLVALVFYIKREWFGIYWVLYAALAGGFGLYYLMVTLISMYNGRSGIYLSDKSMLVKTATREILFRFDDIRQFHQIGRYIGIELFDHPRFITGQKGLLKTVSEQSFRKYGVSLQIPIYAYRVEPEHLWKMLNERLEENRFIQ